MFDPVESPYRNQDPDRAAQEREQCALGQERPSEPDAGGAESRADGELAACEVAWGEVSAVFPLAEAAREAMERIDMRFTR